MALKIRRITPPQSNANLPRGLHPVLERIYLNRGISSESQLQLVLEHLQNFSQLKGVTEAVDVLSNGIRDQRSIMIVGDFDADGATSTAVAMRALTKMGAQHVQYLVPNRFEYGYGLTPEIVEQAKQQRPDIIITVDNGISSIQGVKAARQADIKVVITDHHLAGSELPIADAIVNPNQPGDVFPSKSLAG